MTKNQYLTGLTLYFIGYVLFELPCNIILKVRTSWTHRNIASLLTCPSERLPNFGSPR
jgi:hypothetical protein